MTGPHTFIANTSQNYQNQIWKSFDAIKASVPKFLNFLGAELNIERITHFEGKTPLLAEVTDRNQVFIKFIHLPKNKN